MNAGESAWMLHAMLVVGLLIWQKMPLERDRVRDWMCGGYFSNRK
jgi:hypothetical protein